MKSSIENISNLLAYLSTGFISLAAVITCIDILLRNTSNITIHGIIDIVQLFVMYSVFLAIANGFTQNSHIAVTIITDMFSKRLNHLLASIWWFLSIFLFGIITYASFQQASSVISYGDVSQNIKIPMFFYWLPVVVGLGLSTLGSALSAIHEYIFSEGN